MTNDSQREVVILGGGLAGLTLALQLRRRFGDIDILVLERQSHPLPLAAHKVGESTVEIGAHYFADTIGLREHLDRDHIRKFGFRFFWSEGREDLEGLAELGVSQVLPTPTWQIDRGIFENHLGERARAEGIDFRDGTRVRKLEMGCDGACHEVEFESAAGTERVQARWLVDASGRASLIKRKLDLSLDNDHDTNAVWFRIDTKLAIDDWCDESAWSDRCQPRERWRSTNHLCGPGYWVWLIPLGSGAHSVGIVCDAAMHPLSEMNTFERALEWLYRYQPLVAKACEAERDKLLDFRFLRHYSHSAKQLYSGDRWALTGEAGVFLDPFYSPGSDFIGIANTYICKLIELDRAGQPLGPHAHLYEKLFFSFYANTMSMFTGQYPIFGDAEVMSTKVIWDYTYYWGVLCPLVFHDRLTDLALLGDMQAELADAAELNRSVQAFLRRWYEVTPGWNPATLFDQRELDWFVEMNTRLHDPLDDAGVRERLRSNIQRMRDLAATIIDRARRSCPQLEAGTLPTTASDPTPLFAMRAA